MESWEHEQQRLRRDFDHYRHLCDVDREGYQCERAREMDEKLHFLDDDEPDEPARPLVPDVPLVPDKPAVPLEPARPLVPLDISTYPILPDDVRLMLVIPHYM